MEAVLLIVLVAVAIVGWVLIRRADNDLNYLRAGHIPPSWEPAYRRDHPGPSAPDDRRIATGCPAESTLGYEIPYVEHFRSTLAA
jgi:hypothetical protein